MTKTPSADGGPSPDTPASRRQFLRGLAATAGMTAAGVHLTSPAARAANAPALTSTWNLSAAPVSQGFADGATVPFFRYQPVGGGATRGALPYHEDVEGSVVTIQVANNLPVSFRPRVVGVAEGPLLSPGQTSSFSFAMPPAGTYLLSFSTDATPKVLPEGLRPMTRRWIRSGLSGLLVSRPSSGLQELWNGGPTFDREYCLLYEDADSRVNDPAGTGGFSGVPSYHPDYFTLNGLTFPGTAGDPDTRVVGNLGERILLRIGNLGRMRQCVHFHGYHPEPVARNNVPETVLPPKDTFPVPFESTVDLILTPHQVGTYPLHPHSLTSVTDGGFYVYGQLTLITIA